MNIYLHNHIEIIDNDIDNMNILCYISFKNDEVSNGK